VEGKISGGNIIHVIGCKLNSLTAGVLDGVKMTSEAMSDLLKVTFNLVVHYPKVRLFRRIWCRSLTRFIRQIVECEPQTILASSGSATQKVMGDYWSPKLDGYGDGSRSLSFTRNNFYICHRILLPLLEVFTSLPSTPLAPPLTHVVHSLMAIPVTTSLRSTWLGSVADPPSPSSGIRESTTSSRKSTATLLQAYNIFDLSLAHYLPGDLDPDEPSVRDMCTKETQGTLDNLITPLVVLITRLCIVDVGCRMGMRRRLLPNNLDRISPLEGRSDTLGRCLRLLRSVYHSGLKDALGEMLFAVCDSDGKRANDHGASELNICFDRKLAATLCVHVGYGNVAGFLFQKGILSAPAASTHAPDLTTPSGQQINPITGIVDEITEPPDMTDEEKEQEAEKLFVLFDRLEKTGAIPPSQNPIRKAVQDGRLAI
jgi:hypothetical protein